MTVNSFHYNMSSEDKLYLCMGTLFFGTIVSVVLIIAVYNGWKDYIRTRQVEAWREIVVNTKNVRMVEAVENEIIDAFLENQK